MRALLSFLSRSSPRPAFVVNEGNQPATRIGTYEEVSVPLLDARSAEPPPSIWEEGFCLINFGPSGDPTSSPKHLAQFLSDVRAAVMAHLQAADVALIDNTVRCSAPSGTSRGIVTHVHNDYTPRSAVSHAVRLFGSVAETMRVVQVNAWIPLVARVQDAPLAIMDGQSAAASDLVCCEIRYPDRIGEIQEIHYNPNQRWFWYPDMQWHEMLLFKGFDSASRVTSVPHSAFRNELAPIDAPPRKSVEVRMIALLGPNTSHGTREDSIEPHHPSDRKLSV